VNRTAKRETGLKTTKAAAITKTTLRLRKSLWDKIQHHAIDSDLTLVDIVEQALEQYLKASKEKKA
jgi:predicted transcriptional regulator